VLGAVVTVKRCAILALCGAAPVLWDAVETDLVGRAPRHEQVPLVARSPVVVFRHDRCRCAGSGKASGVVVVKLNLVVQHRCLQTTSNADKQTDKQTDKDETKTKGI
jgi:hypothetical protein